MALTHLFPFEANLDELRDRAETFVDSVFASLESAFLVMPKGRGFITFAEFEDGYETLKRETANFSELDADHTLATVLRVPLVLIILRAMLGFTPSEWAYVAGLDAGIEVTQGFARSLDRRIRLNPTTPINPSPVIEPRIRALVDSACRMLRQGIPDTPPELIHRLDKADTRDGLGAARSLANIGVPYAMLLYE